MSTIIYFVLCLSIMALLLLVRRKNKFVAEYDERQIVYRGKAYKAGFLVSVLAAIFSSLMIFMDHRLIQYAAFMLMASAFIGIILFMVICIWTDAFYSTTENPKNYVLLMGIVVASNAYTFFSSLDTNNIKTVFTSVRSINLLGMITFLIAMITFICKMILEKREGNEA